MKTYYVTYISKTDGDCCTVWTEAESKENAIDEVMHDYWDVKEIIEVRTKL